VVKKRKYKKEKRVLPMEGIYTAAVITTFLSLSMLGTFIFWKVKKGWIFFLAIILLELPRVW
jgi:hypothetical protein